MVAGGCPPATSLGITRGFPRLYPVLGWVTVALLTLAPRAWRPVRLACLIHAANVHSEPGSNPSCVSARPGLPVLPVPRRVEEKIGPAAVVGASRPVPPPPLLSPSPGATFACTGPDGPTLASLKGSLHDRPNCQRRRARRPGPRRTAPLVPSRAHPTEPTEAFAPAVIVLSLLVRQDRTFCSPRSKDFPAVTTGVATAPRGPCDSHYDTPIRAAWFAGFPPLSNFCGCRSSNGSCWRIRLDRWEPGKAPSQETPILPRLRPIDRPREFANSI